MNLIPMKCPSCGSNVEVDAYSKQYTCYVCGTTTIIEKKNDYKTSVHDDSVMEADELLGKKQYNDAINKYDYMTERYGDDPRVWLGLIRAYTRDLGAKLYIDVTPYEPIWLEGFEYKIMDLYHKYLMAETKEQEKAHVSSIFVNYINTNKSEYEELLTKNQTKEEKTQISSDGTDENSQYTETIKAENRIIDSAEILNIINAMQDTLNKYRFISKKEEERNDQYPYDLKEYTFNDNDSSLKFDVDFLDNTEVKIDNTEEFLYVFDKRIEEIKSIYVHFSLNYSMQTLIPKKESDYRTQYINIWIYQHKLDIDVKLLSTDDKISGLYTMLKNMVLKAPTRYDEIVKNRIRITTLTSLGIGMIPSVIICGLLCLSPLLRKVFAESIILLPILGILISFVLGEVVQSIIMGPLYEPIKPDKKYEGYKDGKSVYSDDVEEYTNKSEVLIGKNVHNLENRNKIRSIYNTSLKFLLGGIVVLMVITAVLVVLSKF